MFRVLLLNEINYKFIYFRIAFIDIFVVFLKEVKATKYKFTSGFR